MRRKRSAEKCIAAVLFCGSILISPSLWAYDFAGGAGDPNDPFQIATAAQLTSIGANPNLLNKHFVLISDIDLDPNSPEGQVFDRAVIAPDVDELTRHFQGTPFTGTLDGQGYSITDLVIDSNSEYAGLFGLIGAEGVVCQVNLVGGKVRGRAVYVPPSTGGGGRCGTGALAGENRGSIRDCHCDVNVEGYDFVGGLVGENRGYVLRCSNAGLVIGKNSVGGLIGANTGDVLGCYNTGSTSRIPSVKQPGNSTGNGSGRMLRGVVSYDHISFSGGLVGLNAGGHIRECYSSGIAAGEVGSVGGLVGGNVGGGEIVNSYCTGSVKNDDLYNSLVGGLVGYNDSQSNIFDCYFAGSIRLYLEDPGISYVGGLVGANSGTVSKCMSMAMIGAVRSWYGGTLGGLVGKNTGSVSDCYSLGFMEKTSYYSQSGFIGENSGHIENSFSAIVPIKGKIYGLVAQGDSTSANSFYWNEGVGSLYLTDSNSVGLSSKQMRDQQTYADAGWDFVNTWQKASVQSYPQLRLPEISDESGIEFQWPDAFSGGTGEPNDPYQIGTALQLVLFGIAPSLYDRHVVLTDNIDLDPNGLPGWAFDRAVIAPELHTSDESRYFQGFNGCLDGQGHAITGLRIHAIHESVGLFGWVGWSGMVRNMRVSGLVQGADEPQGEDYFASVLGGLAGRNNGTIRDCFCDVTVQGLHIAGGMVGRNSGNILSSVSAGNVDGGGRVGGLVGVNSQGMVSNSYSCGSASGVVAVGGLVGDNTGGVVNSYSMALVTGKYDAGGLVGRSWLSEGTVSNSFWDVEQSGLSDSDGGAGLTTAETKDPFVLGLNGFGGDPNWIVDAGKDSPRLAWEGSVGETIPEPDMNWLTGQGTVKDAYRIDAASQLLLLSKASALWDRHYVLDADIDLDPDLPGQCIFGRAVFPSFSGTIDGQGHAISNLEITGVRYLGLFGRLASDAKIRDLDLESLSIRATGSFIGGFAGYNNGIIANCSCDGLVSGLNYVGGLVGENHSGIMDCYSSGLASGEDYVGGLVGRNEHTILRSLSACSTSGQYGLGGLVGYNSKDILECSSVGSVTGGEAVGGLVGRNAGTISDGYSTCLVTGSEDVGGLVGANTSGGILNSYSIGSPVGSINIGGLVGHDYWSGTVSSSFWDMETSGRSRSRGGTGLTTAEMQNPNTYLNAGWDFVDIWQICAGRDYPRLQWEQVECGE